MWWEEYGFLRLEQGVLGVEVAPGLNLEIGFYVVSGGYLLILGAGMKWDV